ncbi:hypothetical protein HN011_006293 [Eciton burchellii]|nr:hypothetical protein HN011_006293 [Eciton burchellii]
MRLGITIAREVERSRVPTLENLKAVFGDGDYQWNTNPLQVFVAGKRQIAKLLDFAPESAASSPLAKPRFLRAASSSRRRAFPCVLSFHEKLGMNGEGEEGEEARNTDTDESELKGRDLAEKRARSRQGPSHPVLAVVFRAKRISRKCALCAQHCSALSEPWHCHGIRNQVGCWKMESGPSTGVGERRRRTRRKQWSLLLEGVPRAIPRFAQSCESLLGPAKRTEGPVRLESTPPGLQGRARLSVEAEGGELFREKHLTRFRMREREAPGR